MNIVLIIPTGIGCEIGGHAGDANPVAKLIGKCCNKLIIHPNVVNASDINEMPENTLYVEGSILNRFLNGDIYLKEVFCNRILLVVNKPLTADTINAANAAQMTIGAKIEIMELDTELKMIGFYKDGKASGKVEGWKQLIAQVQMHERAGYGYDALAIQTHIKVEKETKKKYLRGEGGVNPWGGIEAIASKLIATNLDKPVAHSPFESKESTMKDMIEFNEVADPRFAAEMISMCFLHSVLKGLHRAPRIDHQSGLYVNDIDFLITPVNCVGDSHYACIHAGIPIIAVKENKSILLDKMPDDFIIVDNYIEAAGVLMAYKAGIDPRTVRRPAPRS